MIKASPWPANGAFRALSRFVATLSYIKIFNFRLAGREEPPWGCAGHRATQPLSSLVNLIVLLPGLAVLSRRLHDVGKSGWYALVPEDLASPKLAQEIAAEAGDDFYVRQVGTAVP